ncbi:hypothetical protein FSP39_010549 [Pinctada imbricata]|uniref:G-protein coupled receptors family 1 profile domain-containing protein n=1 Tax=Pinctada imbricata TaxID=66713 RepID=A0AA88YV76_PINIB|nr:hypothetical protein FSP39_010549 [Pinctada imbricata]
MNLLLADLLIGTFSIIFLLSGGSLLPHEMNEGCSLISSLAILLLWTYFITAFTITAMALDRLTSLTAPYRYFSIVTSKRCVTLCVSFWIIGFVISLSYVPENYVKFTACSRVAFQNSTITVGFGSSNFLVPGITNLVILLVNLTAYIAIVVVIGRKKHFVSHGQHRVIRKLFAITLSYVVLHGPFCILTIVKGLRLVDGTELESLASVAGIMTTLSILVDPVLYVWRYKSCRYQLMILFTV